MNNTTDDWWLEPRDTESTLNTILAGIYMLALVTTLVMNTITVIVMITTPKLRTHTIAFVVTLAVSDIIFSLYAILINLNTQNILNISNNFQAVWRAIVFAWIVQIHGYYGNLLLVSLERWLFIAKPFFYHRYVTTRAVIISITMAWVIALAINIPYFCIDVESIGFYYENVAFTYINPVIHTTLFFVLLAIYTHICLITLKHLKKLPNAKHNYQQTGRNSDRTVARERLSLHAKNLKSIKLLISVCGIFFLFVSPYVYYIAFNNICDQGTDELVLHGSLMLFALFHCSNFFVYALGIPLFKKTLRNKCCRLLCCFRGSHVGSG